MACLVVFTVDAVRPWKAAASTADKPALQLPWRYGTKWGQNNGNSYNCGGHTTTQDKYAIDFALPDGTTVTSVAAGTAHIGTATGYGNFVWIQHPNSFVSFYAHLRSAGRVPEGTVVGQGQPIALSDNSGTGSHGAHLHFALRSGATSSNNGTGTKPEPMSGYTVFGSYGIHKNLAGACINTASPLYTASTTGSLSLSRYSGSKHWVTVGNVSSGYPFEFVLGDLLGAGAGGISVYGCLLGDDHFLSSDSNCEGQTFLRLEGNINTQSAVGRVPIYRCYTGADHFASTDPNCEGRTTEALLGYGLTATPLNRFYNTKSTADHWITTGSVWQYGSSGPGLNYALEAPLGSVVLGPGPGKRAVYSCLSRGVDQMLSLDPNCEGTAALYLEGYLFTDYGSSSNPKPVYRCKTAAKDHFASPDPACEGQVTEAFLGWAV